MKKIFFSVVLAGLSVCGIAQNKVGDVAKFASETIDLGKIKQGSPTKGTFSVTNIGKAPLIIEQANPTCGCTISDYTKEPIGTNKNGVINATYNAANAGSFTKHLTVKFAGIDEVKSITLTGEVLSADDYSKWESENATKVKVDTKPVVATKPVVKKTTQKHTYKKHTYKKGTYKKPVAKPVVKKTVTTTQVK